jgi:SAM-dependent methyltransferase
VPDPQSQDRSAKEAAALRFDDDRVWELNQNPWTRLRIEALREYLPRDAGSLLDVGCGDGQIANAAKAMLVPPRRVFGIDRGLPGLRRFRSVGQPIVGDGDALPFPDRSFDLVVCSEVLEHLPPPVLAGAAKELARVTNRDLVISVPDREDLLREQIRCPECRHEFHAWGHLHSFDLAAIDGLFAGMTRIQAGTAGPRRRYHKGLIAARRALGRYPYEATAVCPHCGNRAFPDRRRDPVMFACDALNSLANPFKRDYWLFARYRRAQ